MGDSKKILRIGLISDTHMPERCLALPPTLNALFRDVDLILHAGDVGELWVLERLSALAPVIAVHGNDDSAESQAELPFQQLIHIGGQRLLLWHSHFPKRADELAFRREDDTWARVLKRTSQRAAAVGASVAIFGHIHIPLVWQQDGVLLINPGALASGTFQLRMRVQTIAMLGLCDGGATVQHYDLSDGSQYHPEINWEAGFQAALDTYQQTLLAQPIAFPKTAKFWGDPAVRGLMRRVAIPCWQGDRDHITAADYWRALEKDTQLAARTRQQFREALAPHL